MRPSSGRRPPKYDACAWSCGRRGAVPATSIGYVSRRRTRAASPSFRLSVSAVSSSAIGTARCATMSPRSGFALAVHEHPVDRATAAVARQQRAVQIERTARREREQLRAEELADVEGEEQLRLRLRHRLDDVGRIHGVRHEERETGLTRALRDGPEPDGLARLIAVRDDQLDVGAEREQLVEADPADVLIRHHDDAHGSSSPARYTARTRYDGRPRTSR